MDLDLAARLERALSRRPVALAPLPGGCVADVRRVDLAGGGRAVAKLASDAAGSTLETEAFMLRYLAERSPLPVPRVLHAEPDLLVLEHVENDGRTGEPTERDAAAHLAALHDLRPDPPHDRDFGFDRPTPIGSLRQPNPWTRSWVAFFRDQRLLERADQATDAGRLPASLRARLDSLAARLDDLIAEPPDARGPSLIHGDVWSGNVLVRAGSIAAFIDPAISYSHPEIELAFITLFSTFGRAFFDRYQESRPLEDPDGFFRTRRHVYNLYPLLVHARLFGASYVHQIDAALARLGF